MLSVTGEREFRSTGTVGQPRNICQRRTIRSFLELQTGSFQSVAQMSGATVLKNVATDGCWCLCWLSLCCAAALHWKVTALLQSQKIVPGATRAQQEQVRLVGPEALRSTATLSTAVATHAPFRPWREREAAPGPKTALLAVSDMLGPGGEDKVKPMLQQVCFFPWNYGIR